MILLLPILSSSVYASFLYSQTEIGCLTYSSGVCSMLCPLGQQECGASQRCEYGYFKHKDTCIMCPYQRSNDLLKLYCMDCVEHPNSWTYTRTCSYEYSVESGKPNTGTYVKITKAYTELFFIGEAVTEGVSTSTLPRDVTYKYQVYPCSGCLAFCDPKDTSKTGCNSFTSSYSEDEDKKGIQCLTGYYFSANLCNACLTNCYKCSDGAKCQECRVGYMLSSTSTSCTACPNNCLDCLSYVTQVTSQGMGPQTSVTVVNQLCFQCVAPLISSLSQDQCHSCGSSCERCEYVTYKTTQSIIYPTRSKSMIEQKNQVDYVKRCRQCSGSTTISHNGVDCVECQVRNCLKCYYKIRGQETTLDIDFKPSESNDNPSIQLCYLCSPLFYVSADGADCISYPVSTIPNCALHRMEGVVKCSRCASPYIYDQFVGGCYGTCTDYIQNCVFCYSYRSLDIFQYVAGDGTIQNRPPQTLFQCVHCNSGFYPDFFSGLCSSCPNHCSTCWQYTPTYNLTDFIFRQVQVNAQTRQQYLNDIPIRLSCTLCDKGFDLYDGQCLGCTSNCQVAGPSDLPNVMGDELVSACMYKTLFAFCSECYDSFNDRSISSDRTQCQKCPEKCIACRNRDSFEIWNPYFSPTNIELLQYGRLCYAVQSQTGNPNLVVDYNTDMGLPIMCSYSSIQNSDTKKCSHSVTSTIVIYCDDEDFQTDYLAATNDQRKYMYKLNDFYEQESEAVASIVFSNLEKLNLYQEMNKKPVEQMHLFIEFKSPSNTCILMKDTIIKTAFHQNVYALKDFNVYLKNHASSSSITLKIRGQLVLSNYVKLSIENIKFREHQEDTYPSVSTFGLIVNGTLSTVLTLQNVDFGFDSAKSASQADISIEMNMLTFLSLNKVALNYFDEGDLFSLKPQQGYYIDISDLTLYKCKFDTQQLFVITEASTITVKGLIITQSALINSQVFVDASSSSKSAAPKITFENCMIKFSYLQNSLFIKTAIAEHFQVRNFDIISNLFAGTSVVFISNNFDMQNVLASQNTFRNNSFLIYSAEQIKDFMQNSILSQSFSNIVFSENSCTSSHCLMRYESPYLLDAMKSNVFLEAIRIESNIITLESHLTESFQSAILQVLNVDLIKVNNVLVKNTRRVIALSFTQIGSLEITNGYFDWADPTVGKNQTDPREKQTNEQSTVTFPVNNKMPSSEECDQQKDFQYNQAMIYVKSFLFGVRIADSAFKRLLTVDSSIVQIESYDSIEKKTNHLSETRRPGLFYSQMKNELIEISNVNFYNNSLGVVELSSPMSAIFIESDQIQTIKISNLRAVSNHMHQLVDSIGYNLATCLLIISPAAELQISDSYFEDNRASRTLYGITQFRVAYVSISKTKFLKTNLLNKSWGSRFEEHQLASDSDFRGFFKVQSIGSNLFVQSQNLIVTSCQFIDSYSAGGSAIYFIGQGDASLKVIDSHLENQQASLLVTDRSDGGAIYVDAQNCNLDLEITNVKMKNVVARDQGGCIMINPSQGRNNVQMTNSQFLDCQSIDGAVLYAKFSITSESSPIVTIRRCRFIGNNFINFLNGLPDVDDIEKALLLNQAATINIQGGFLTLEQCEFRNLGYISTISFTKSMSILLQDLLFQDYAIYHSPMLRMTLQDSVSQLFLNGILIQNCKEIDLYSSQQRFEAKMSCNENMISEPVVATQTCKVTIGLRQYYNDMDNYYLAQQEIYNVTIENQYSSMSNKYAFPSISIVSYANLDTFYDSSSRLLTYFDVSTSFNAVCFLSEIYDAYSPENITSLINIVGVEEFQSILVSSLGIEGSNCSRCYGGLFQIFKISARIPQEMPYGSFRVSMSDMSCSGNVIGFYGCIFLSAENTYSTSNFSRSLQEVPDTILVKITTSKFLQNIAHVGTGITIFDLKMKVIQCEFSDNIALLVGGAIVVRSSMQEPLLVEQSKFTGNTAQIAGALYVSGQTLRNMTSNEVEFIANTASLFGSNYETYPSKLGIQIKAGTTVTTSTFQQYDGDIDDDGVIDSLQAPVIEITSMEPYKLPNYQIQTDKIMLPSGQPISSYVYYYNYTEEQVPFEWVFYIVNLDDNKQIMHASVTSDSCSVSGRMMDQNNPDYNKTFLNNFTSISSVYFNQKIGAFDFSQMQIFFDPYISSQYYLQLKFTCTSVKIPVYTKSDPVTLVGFDTNYALYVNVRTIPCQMGESRQGIKCIACSEGSNSYSVEPNSFQCSGLNPIQMMSVTPIKIRLKAGYWRASSTNGQVEECYHLKENCNGGWIPGDASCFSGHVGALCEACDINGVRDEPYSISKKYTCGACAGTVQTNTITIVAISLFTLCSLMLSVRGNYLMLENFVHEQVLQSIGVRVSSSQNNLSILIKLLTNYLQIIAALTTFRINIPTEFVSSMEVLGNPTQSMSYSLDCFLVQMAPVSILYFRMIWALIMPINYLAVFFFGYFLLVLIGKAPLKKAIIYTTFIYMFIYLQPTLVGGFIALLSSRRIGGLEWVQSDVTYRYDTITHQFWILIFIAPNLIIWSTIFPLLFMRAVRKHRQNLKDIEVRRKWGYFYNEYTEGAYLWEFVKIFEKQLVIISLTYYEDKIVIKGLIVFLIVFFYGAFSFTFIPYKLKKLNFIDQMSTAVCAVSLCLGVLIYASQSEQLDYLQYIMFLIIGGVNALFILLILYNLFEGYLDKFQDQVDKLRDKVKERYPGIQFKYPFLRKWLINRQQMRQKVRNLWATLIYETKKGIKRRRINPHSPLFDDRPQINIIEISHEKEIQGNFDSKPNSRSALVEHPEELQQLNPETPQAFDKERSARTLQVIMNAQADARTPDIQKIYPAEFSPDEKPQKSPVLKKVRY